MSSQRNALDELIRSVKQERDELKLQLHLAKMEAKEEYERLSKNFDKLAQQYEPVRDAVEESAKGLFAALALAADEMQNGFQRVRKAIGGK